MTLEELHRYLDAYCNEAMSRARHLRRRRHRNPATPTHEPLNSGAMETGEAPSTEHASSEANEDGASPPE